MLEGKHRKKDIHWAAAMLIKHMKASTPPDVLPRTITVQEFVALFDKWNECTSTSPSGMDLSHCHALAKKHSIKEDDERFPETEEK